MNEQEALNVLDQVAAKFQGTRKDHEVLNEALSSLQRLINSLNGKPEVSEP